MAILIESAPYAAGAAAKSLQSCLTLCDPIDGSPPGSPVPGILQARTLEWAAISFSNAWKWKVKVKSLSRGRLFGTPWTAAYQAPMSMGISRWEYWSGLPLPSPSAPNKGMHEGVIQSRPPAPHFILCLYGFRETFCWCNWPAVRSSVYLRMSESSLLEALLVRQAHKENQVE